MRTFGHWRTLLAAAPLLALAHMAAAQEPSPAPTPATDAPAQTTPAPAATPAAVPATPEAAPVTTPQDATPTPQAAAPATPQEATPAAAAPAPQAAAPTPAATPAKAAPAAKDAKGKVKKVEYTGPNTIIVLPPTPMLDEEGKQRLDPDGQPMFNPPVKQQRDKKGHPLFDENGKPVFQTKTELGYDEHGKKLHAVKEKEPKMTPMVISRGTFTIDGMIGKAELNYNIADLKFIYMYAPGIGTVVVSNQPFPGGKEEKNAFDDKTLTVSVGEHHLQLASDQRLLGKHPESAYVLLDRDFKLPSKYPVVGYGKGLKAPYAWPGGKPNEMIAGELVAPPPLPQNLRPVMLLSPCPAGQMRKPAPPVLPGEPIPEQPCVPIPKVVPVKSAPAAPPASPASAAPAPAATPTPQ